MFKCSGYMSPEYAMQGLFSVKSDVFSFGVLILEIVSGRKNTSFYNDEQYYLSIVGFVSLSNWLSIIFKAPIGNCQKDYTSQFLSFTLVIFQAWKLWNDGNSMALIEPAIWDPCFRMEMLRCIHVGLLCVQETARDRPTISTIISMLNSDIVDLPFPKQPAFTERQIASNCEHAQQDQIRISICNVTHTTIYGR